MIDLERMTPRIIAAIADNPELHNCHIAYLVGACAGHVKRIRRLYDLPSPPKNTHGRAPSVISAALRREMEANPCRPNGEIAALCGVTANRVANFRNRFGYPHARAS